MQLAVCLVVVGNILRNVICAVPVQGTGTQVGEKATVSMHPNDEVCIHTPTCFRISTHKATIQDVGQNQIALKKTTLPAFHLNAVYRGYRGSKYIVTTT